MNECDMVSIIVPVYNAEESLERCIKSIMAQTYANLEVLLINDGSTDKSLEIIKRYENIDNRIKCFDKKKSGVSSARNYGIEKANGKYVFFLDADDTIDKDVINNLLSESNKNKDYLVVGFFKNIIKNKENICKYNSGTYKKEEYIKMILDNKIMGVVWNYLFKLGKIEKIRFDENTSFLEDTLFLIEYLDKVEFIEIYNDEKNYYNYYFNDNSISHSNKKALQNIKDFIYSLDRIDYITNKKYADKIKNKKVKLIKNECKKLEEIEDYKKILNSQQIKKALKKDISFFSILYSLNNPYALKGYYNIRSAIKNICLKIMKK